MTTGYVTVDGGLELYYQRQGDGSPLILLHGTMGTIESCFADLLTILAEHFEVIAVEMQGHGRTRDIDRPLSYPQMARDTARFLELLDIERAHFVGYSMGGAIALQLAIDRPELVDHLVFAGGAAYESLAVYPKLQADFESFDPHQLDGTTWHQAYRRVAPDPDAWIGLVTKVNELDRRRFLLPDDRLAALQIPTLLIVGDADIVPPEHVVALFRLLGGGIPGDLVGLPRAQLAVLPGTTHVGVLERITWLSSMILAFLGQTGEQ